MDNYQAVYDAVRSRFHCSVDGDQIVRGIADLFYQASVTASQAAQDACITEQEKQRPSVLFRPTIAPDGPKWCALYGENIQEGVCGFGDTPDAAMRDFDRAWLAPK